MSTRIYSFALGMLAAAFASAANALSEFILFPEARLNYEVMGASHPPERNSIGTSLFYTYENDKLRILGEGVVYSDDQDIERLQAGWQVQPNTTLWLGLYHNPLIRWNDLFHHGAFFQTSITRPAITLFEGDEGGALQTQLLGGLIEGDVPIGSGALGYSLALGTGTAVNAHRALDTLDFGGDSKHRPNAALRASYYPDANNENNKMGVTFSRSRTFSDRFPAEDIRQAVNGAYLHWEWHELRLLSAVYWLSNVMNIGGESTTETFGNGYLQLEYEAHSTWTFFGRTEGTRGGESDAYLSMFPEFARRRNAIGIRYDFMHLQALKLEVAHTQYQDTLQHAIRLQWTAGFPVP